MKIGRAFVCAFVCSLAVPAVRAQEATSFVFGTYYRCSEATEDRADAIFKEAMGPILDKHVKAGHLTAYGWSRHWMGGEWRRLEYLIGGDLGAMVDARDAYIDELVKQHAALNKEFSTICSSHDDYIWVAGATSQTPETVGRERPAVGTTTYFQCDSREGEADAIVKTAFAPVLSQHVKEGKIASWTWLEHVAGGKYRRALVTDGPSHKAAIAYWKSLSDALEASQPELSRQFTEICPSHSDYIWDLSSN
jgi:hypothetical protein